MSTTARDACTPEAFEARYRADPDPWQFTSSVYERERYAVTIAALTQPRYANAFEPGCSVGELTALLAPRCDRLLATDVSETAVERARARCASYPQVTVERGDVTAVVVDRPFDLIVFSEIAYYFEASKLESLANRLANDLCLGGTFLAVHWLGRSADHILHGDEAHEVLLGKLPLQHLRAERHPGFRLDLWMRT
jgi:trans-aconitate methyltransferase